MKKEAITRIRVLSVFLGCFAVLLITRLYLLQVVHGSEFAEKADLQYVSNSGSTFDRGAIYFLDKDGNKISGATLKSGFIIAINPEKVTDPERECLSIQKIITDFDCANFIARANKKGDIYEEVGKKIEEGDANKIADLKLAGVSLYKDKWRYYPGGTLAAQALGFVGYRGNELAGRYGLESTYDSLLKRNDESQYVNFFAEMFTDISKTISKSENLEGDIVTTIDPTTQGYLEEQLNKVRNKYGADTVGGIIINPKNGEIYALALTPSFDPNNFQSVDNSSVFTNNLVEDVYEMGSVIKPLTMAAGIDTGVVNANTIYQDTGSVVVDNKVISNFDKKGRGDITLQQALGQSLNTGFVFVERKIGNATFARYMKNFGLGSKTGIDLPNEATGLISNLNSPRDIEYATASFGQGVAMTPMEAVRAWSALANGGTLITPHLGKSINYKLGYSKTIDYLEGERVINKTTSEEITRMLVVDYDTYFQNGASKNPNYSIAEKTGTAQIALPNGRGYYEDRYLHSFMGYLPAYDPKFLVFLYAVDPRGVQYSSESLGPIFVDMTKFLINYYNVSPDR